VSSAGAHRKRAQRYIDRIDVRRRLADAQVAVVQAIQNRDPESIAEARRTCADLRQRLRDLS
jgi:predicted transcriptional regulator